MANIKKPFNFRSGIQVDDDNFIINSNGLVGIGSTIPTEVLDVFGNVRVRGILYADNVLKVDESVFTVDILNVGVTSISSGIVTSSSPSGIVTYYGDGGKLLNLPTSQWVDVDPGFGYESIYAAGNVGVATTNPIFTLQVGGNPVINLSGIGINSTGDVYSAGVITATSFSGSGINLTTLNASNLSSGTIPNARFAQNISISGVITASTHFAGNLVGIASTALNLNRSIISGSGLTGGGELTADRTINVGAGTGISVNSDDIQLKNSGSLTDNRVIKWDNTNGQLSNTIISDTGINIGIGSTQPSSKLDVNGNVKVSGIVTATTFSGSLTGTATTATKLETSRNFSVSGDVSTSSATAFDGSGNVNLNVSLSNNFNANTSGIITASAFNGDLTGDVTGTATTAINVDGGYANPQTLNVTGVSTFNSDLLPYGDITVSIGTFGKSFAQAFVHEITVGYASSTTISTRTGDLILDSDSGNVIVDGIISLSGPTNFNYDVNFGTNNIYVDSSNNKIGIGSTQPDEKLSVVGDVKINGYLTLLDDLLIEKDGQTILSVEASAERLTVKNLVVTGVANGVTAVGAAISVKAFGNESFSEVTGLVFSEEFTLLTESNTGSIGLSSIVGIANTNSYFGIGTDLIPENTILAIGGNTQTTGDFSSDGQILAQQGFYSGFGTSVKIYGSIGDIIAPSTINFESTGIGTVSIIVPNSPDDFIFLEALWNSGVNNDALSLYDNVGIGTTTATSNLTVYGNVKTTGITTSENGFSSGIGTGVKITTSGNQVIFTVPGVGSTSLTLYP